MLIEVYADLICPWCYIGKHRLDRAMAERPGLAFDRRWQPFELNPEMPARGMDRFAYLSAKFGGAERARQVYAVIEETAQRDGLTIALDRIRRTPNTLDAHRLVRRADALGAGDALVDMLFRAYFVEGQDLGDRDLLAERAAAVGLDPAESRRFLDGDEETAAVRTAETLARQLGIQAVPCYVFDRRYALAGAQEPVAFLPLLDLGTEEAAMSRLS
ncbi:DsbA family oxidoreductase [Arenibaculum pallidiluteum]|uniref:DsbA family oxidoreductase n=1 Tax=Arenibaculum pallidiluteum TaxID=2812559 RepID=UPI001A95B4EC|nr:DsbA family oxidoreductase [Arenibaculum pallidiluteum]